MRFISQKLTLNRQGQNSCNIFIYLLLNQYQYCTPINFRLQILNCNDLACHISQVATIATFGPGHENYNNYHQKKR